MFMSGFMWKPRPYHRNGRRISLAQAVDDLVIHGKYIHHLPNQKDTRFTCERVKNGKLIHLNPKIRSSVSSSIDLVSLKEVTEAYFKQLSPINGQQSINEEQSTCSSENFEAPVWRVCIYVNEFLF